MIEIHNMAVMECSGTNAPRKTPKRTLAGKKGFFRFRREVIHNKWVDEI